MLLNRLLELLLTIFLYCVLDGVVQGVEVPIIDIGALRGDSENLKVDVATLILRACEDVGFFIIVNHGIDEQIVQNIWNSTYQFFDLPEHEKTKFIKPQHEYPFGYTKLGGEILSAGKNVEIDSDKQALNAPDLKEMFSIGPKNPLAGLPPRIFPSIPMSFENTWDRYYDAMSNLADSVLEAFAIALQLPPNFFQQFTDHHSSALRALNYPALNGEFPPIPGQLRASAHTDYGTITILKSDGPGLQVSKDRDPPQWFDVPYVKNGFIVNLGDLMKRWTNDKWLSTLHRVINPLNQEFGGACLMGDDQVDSSSVDYCRSFFHRRQSIAFFHNVNRDAIVHVLNSDTPKYEPIVAGDFLMQKHLAATASGEK